MRHSLHNENFGSVYSLLVKKRAEKQEVEEGLSFISEWSKQPGGKASSDPLPAAEAPPGPDLSERNSPQGTAQGPPGEPLLLQTLDALLCTGSGGLGRGGKDTSLLHFGSPVTPGVTSLQLVSGFKSFFLLNKQLTSDLLLLKFVSSLSYSFTKP